MRLRILKRGDDGDWIPELELSPDGRVQLIDDEGRFVVYKAVPVALGPEFAVEEFGRNQDLRRVPLPER